MHRILSQARDNDLDDEILLELQKVAGRVRYTDPVSCDESIHIEKEIASTIEELSHTVDLFSVEGEAASLEDEDTIRTIKKLMELVEEREALIARTK
ncbi:MAG: hypothetical protein PHO50_07825 [Aminobacterium colombiense]|nr:hypothetical protein [Aminobacterium colombiense]